MTASQKNWLILIFFTLIGMAISYPFFSGKFSIYLIYFLGFAVGYWFRGVENKE